MRRLLLAACFAMACTHRDEVVPTPAIENKALVDASPPVPAPAPSTSSPPKLDDAACRAECRKLSKECDTSCAGDKGCLRRCGCAKISCEHGCPKTGVADFKCR